MRSKGRSRKKQKKEKIDWKAIIIQILITIISELLLKLIEKIFNL